MASAPVESVIELYDPTAGAHCRLARLSRVVLPPPDGRGATTTTSTSPPQEADTPPAGKPTSSKPANPFRSHMPIASNRVTGSHRDHSPERLLGLPIEHRGVYERGSHLTTTA